MKNRIIALFLSAVLLLCGCNSDKGDIDIMRAVELKNCSVNSVEFKNPLSDSNADVFRELLKNGSLTPVEADNTEVGNGEYLEFYDENESYKLSIRTGENGEEYIYAVSGNTGSFFSMDKDSMEEFSFQLSSYAPKAFYGVIDTHISDNLYIVRPDDDTNEIRSCDKIFVNSEIPFNDGDRVRVGYYGGIMETYPGQINQLFIKGGSTVTEIP
ncbi:MAG: hypothetical protein ACI4KO_03705 [Ruminiclostridium sp.]